MRYSYLRGPGGRFRNPYDHGVRKNCSDFFLKGYNEDIEKVVQTLQPDEEMGPIQMRSAVSQNSESVPLHANGSDHSSTHLQGNSNSHRQSSSKCCSNSKKSERTPLGLGLGLGRNSPSSRYLRSLLPLWFVLRMQMCWCFFILACLLHRHSFVWAISALVVRDFSLVALTLQCCWKWSPTIHQNNAMARVNEMGVAWGLHKHPRLTPTYIHHNSFFFCQRYSFSSPFLLAKVHHCAMSLTFCMSGVVVEVPTHFEA